MLNRNDALMIAVAMRAINEGATIDAARDALAAMFPHIEGGDRVDVVHPEKGSVIIVRRMRIPAQPAAPAIDGMPATEAKPAKTMIHEFIADGAGGGAWADEEREEEMPA